MRKFPDPVQFIFGIIFVFPFYIFVNRKKENMAELVKSVPRLGECMILHALFWASIGALLIGHTFTSTAGYILLATNALSCGFMWLVIARGLLVSFRQSNTKTS